MSTPDRITIKVTHTSPQGVSTTRKLTSPPPLEYPKLLSLVSTRFQLTEPIELVYKDEDGDLITLSSDEELAELVQAFQNGNSTLRFEVRQPGTDQAVASDVGIVQTERKVTSEASKEQDVKEGSVATEGTEDQEWTEVDASERPTGESEVGNLSLPVDFEDPADTPLPSPSHLAQEAITKEFPTSSSSSSQAHPGSFPFPDDPSDIPLPTSDEPLPFSNLPNSLTSFLTSLGSRSSTLSTNLTAALNPSSPSSPTARLSSILSASTLDDLPLVASSLVQMGSEFAEIAKDVVQGVRREAEEIRDEFGRLRTEVERERSRFRDEVRDAMSTAAEGWSAAAATPREGEQHEMSDIVDEATTIPPVSTGTVPSPPVYSPSSVASESVRSSVSPSTSHLPLPTDDSSTTESRETARALHKQAKQARKNYRAAVREAREAKRQAKRSKAEGRAGEKMLEGSTSDMRIPGGMPSTSTSTSTATSSSDEDKKNLERIE